MDRIDSGKLPQLVTIGQLLNFMEKVFIIELIQKTVFQL